MQRPVHRTPLTPLAFLGRAQAVYPDHVAVVHGAGRRTYRDLAGEVTRLAHALRASGIDPGDRVAYLCPNTPELVVAHFAVPLAGAVLVAINTRLARDEIRTILTHSAAKLLVVDSELLESVAGIADVCPDLREVVRVDDATDVPGGAGTPYATLLARGADEAIAWEVDDEDATIAINYTSGTTGQPKGVMYTHRGAYLNALGENITAGHDHTTSYLWTLPMFHCNGWCHPWAVTAVGGTHVTLRAFRPDDAWALIRAERVTHLCGAPPVLSGLANSPAAAPLDHPLCIMTAAAPPNPVVLEQIEALGIRLIHVYGLTETYGPYTVCQPQVGWERRAPGERALLLARQGVAMVTSDPVRVVDERGVDIPRDGIAQGEVVMRGNDVMKGYYRDPDATAHAFRHGWFHSGDIAVWHPDGYIELRDRAKDIVISGGENISTIEVEQALLRHTSVLEVAVIGVPDDTWGERPRAFVVCRDGAVVTADALRAHVRAMLAHYKCPDDFAFVAELPKTSTGKVQKYVLREQAWAGRSSRIN